MSNTRRAESGKPFRQERFSSSAEFERGLLANLVARRCELLDTADERELVWFIQYLSHQEGGLKRVVATLLEKNSDRIGTASMRKFGCRAGQTYDAEKTRSVRSELPWRNRLAFLLADENGVIDVITKEDHRDEALYGEIGSQALSQIECGNRVTKPNPAKYPAQSFHDLCRKQCSISELESYLKEICLNPALPVANGPWWFHELPACLREYQAAWIAERSAGVATTEIGAQVCDALDYALETKCLVLIDGLARIGKTFSAKAFCARHPGRVRYVQVPSSNDEIGFFRAIAKALGVSINLNSKAQELRQRVEETLQSGHLAIILDEAHFLWPNLIDPRTLPARVNWIMTALVNYNVPVALITTPQFLKTQRMMEAKTRWTSEQFTGRVGHYQPLPENLCETDLEKVSKSLLPEGDAQSIEILVNYAQASSKYIAGIESLVRRARYLAAKENRSKVTIADIRRASKGSILPSDKALAEAMEAPQKTTGRRSVNRSLTADLPAAFDRSGDRQQPILEDEKSSETAGRNRLELHRDSGAFVPG